MAKRARAEADEFAEVVTHLQYLGYDVGAPAPDGWSFAQHPFRYDIHVRPFPMGTRLSCCVPIGAQADNSRAAWLEFLNSANERGRVAQFSLCEGHDGILLVRMTALVSGPYTRRVFSMMIDLWHEDLDVVRHRPEFPAVVDDVDDREGEAATAQGSGSNVH